MGERDSYGLSGSASSTPDMVQMGSNKTGSRPTGKGLSPWENIGLCQTGFKTGWDWAVQPSGKEELFLSKTYVKGAVPSVETEESLKLTPRKKLFKINIWTIPGTCYSTFSFRVFCKTWLDSLNPSQALNIFSKETAKYQSKIMHLLTDRQQDFRAQINLVHEAGAWPAFAEFIALWEIRLPHRKVQGPV